MADQLAVSDIVPGSPDGIEARIHDPLWLLARQWQMGELRGEDAGSPAGARLVVESAPLSSWQPLTAAAATPYAPAGRPLEASVEAEAWDTSAQAHFRLAAETGLRLQELLRDVGGKPQAVPILRDGFKLATPRGGVQDAAARRYAGFLAGRAIDGIALYRRLGAARPLPALPPDAPFSSIAPADRAVVLAQINRWLGELDALLPAGTLAGSTPASPAWQRERMEYGFAVGARLANLPVALAAREHREGEADWSSFAVDPARTAGAGSSTQRVATFIPAPVQFAGMPLPRFWELESARVNLPALDAARTDPASRMLLDFALRYGNDWHIVPLTLSAGSISRLSSLVVTDTFGERLLIRHTAAADGPLAPWRMFALSILPGADPAPYVDLFLMPATPAQVLESAPTEEVHLVRDEMANLAWAIEARAESAAARPVDVQEQDQLDRAQRTAPAAASPAAAFRYRLGIGAPDHWVPLLPVPAAAGQPRRLERAAAPRIEADAIAGALLPRTRILEPGTVLRLYDEEVPREGSVVQRRYRYARAADGSAHLWIGRRKVPGRGEASSGLRFDTLE